MPNVSFRVVNAAHAEQVNAASSRTKSGLFLHDSTPTSWAILGRRGDAGARAKARNMTGNKPEPQRDKWGSSNIYLIQAMNNAAVYKDYGMAREWLDEMRRIGNGEGGPLYWPAGDVGYAMVVMLLAERDGVRDVYDQFRSYLAWCKTLMKEMEMPRPRKLITRGPKGNSASPVTWAAGNPHRQFFMPGSRAMFSGHLEPNWYANGHGTNAYETLANIPNRRLDSRFTNYRPSSGVERCWDSWQWMVSQLKGWINPTPHAQPTLMQQTWIQMSLAGHITGADSGSYKMRFGIEVVRLSNGHVFVTASHATAAPKPPVNFIHYDANTETAFFAVPDGYRNYGNKGQGFIRSMGGRVYAEATSEGTTLRSPAFPLSMVESHRVLPAKATHWRNGDLHPSVPVPPTPPPPRPPDDDDKDIWDRIADFFSRLWHSLEKRI